MCEQVFPVTLHGIMALLCVAIIRKGMRQVEEVTRWIFKTLGCATKGHIV